jgi:hypothetical protein
MKRESKVAEVDRLLGAYIDEYLAGDRPDPLAFLDQLRGDERERLSGLIETFLLDAPSEQWDQAAYERSMAKEVVESLDRALHGQGGLWPAVLPRLRDRARLRRSELVERLATSLGAASQQEKVGGYYHEMEQGLLPAPGVSDRVLEALGEIVGESAQRLREAGNALLPGTSFAADDPDGSFARLAVPDPEQMPPAAQSPGVGSPHDSVPISEDLDEIDELFRGG